MLNMVTWAQFVSTYSPRSNIAKGYTILLAHFLGNKTFLIIFLKYCSSCPSILLIRPIVTISQTTSIVFLEQVRP